MNIINLLTIINFIGIAYLTFLFYRISLKVNKQSSQQSLPSVASGLKIKLNRFNPFDEVGGDQSFVLCILDSNRSGVIITSLHHRDFTRIYAKTITKGESNQGRLSKEEIAALQDTIKN